MTHSANIGEIWDTLDKNELTAARSAALNHLRQFPRCQTNEALIIIHETQEALEPADNLAKELAACFGCDAPEEPALATFMAILNRGRSARREQFARMAEEAEDALTYFVAIRGKIKSSCHEQHRDEIKQDCQDLINLSEVLPGRFAMWAQLTYADNSLVPSGSTSQGENLYRQVFGQCLVTGNRYLMMRALQGLLSLACHLKKPDLAVGYSQLLAATSSTSSAPTALATSQMIYAQCQAEPMAPPPESLPNPTNLAILNEQNQQVLLGGQWHHLRRSPLVYRFLAIIAETRDFTPKEAIAASLWPDESYNSSFHDPRIFDIARRIRKLITASKEGNWRLASGRFGYRLIATDGPTAKGQLA